MASTSHHRFHSFLPQNTSWDFARQRYFWLVVSILTILFAAVELYREGLPLGIEFAGGADIQVQFDESVATADVRRALEDGGIQGASVQSIEAAAELDLEKGLTVSGGAGAATPEFLIKVKAEKDKEISETVQSVRAALEAKFGPSRTTDNPEGDWEVRRQESASPAAVAELTQKGRGAIFGAMLIIFIYIVVRFSQVDWMTGVGYGVGALVCLIHDICILISAFVITKTELSLTVVAALLTVIGYSLNDTIVVFDRIRENHSRFRARDLWETVNKSVNESLSRTIITSGTTILVLAALFFLGGSVIHDFAFTLLVGIIVGTYSSIFIASPFFVWTTNALRRSKAAKSSATSKTPQV